MRASPYRVGIDIVNVHRIQDSIDRFGQRFLDRIFTPEEQQYCRHLTSVSAMTQSLAVRFAAKEATMKVLRPDSAMLDWHTIEVRRSPEGWCDIELSDEAADLAQYRGIIALSLSMSHEGDYATAVVVADIV